MKKIFGDIQKDVLGRKVLGVAAGCKFCGAGIETYDKVFYRSVKGIKDESGAVLDQGEIEEQAHDIARAEIEKGLQIGAVTIADNGSLIWYRPPTKCCERARAKPAPVRRETPDLDGKVSLMDVRSAWKMLAEHFGRTKGLTADLEQVYFKQLSHLDAKQFKSAVSQVVKDPEVRYEKILAFIIEHTKKPIDTRQPVNLEGVK